LWYQYSQAFSVAGADVEGLQFAALETLQHGLVGDAEGAHRVDDRHVSGRRVVDEQGAELLVDADPPRGAGGVLLAGDESGLQPAEDGGRRDAELIGGFVDGPQFAVGRLGRGLVCGDGSVAAQAADDDRGEPLAAGGAAALAVEDPGDGAVVVVGGESLDELDCVLVGARLWLGLGERDSEFGDRAALPADRQRCAAGLASEVDGDVLDQAPDELLAVAVGGGGCGPDAAEVGAEGERPFPFLVGQRAGLLLLAQGELGFGRGELLQRVLPVALQSARDESVLGLDLAVAALGPLCLVSGAFDLQPPLLQRGVLIGLERLGGLQRAFTPAGVSAASSASATAWSIRPPPTRRHQLPRFSTRIRPGQ
jgi:hypothetical protein